MVLTFIQKVGASRAGPTMLVLAGELDCMEAGGPLDIPVPEHSGL